MGPLLVDGSWVEDCKYMADCPANCFSSVFTSGLLTAPQPHQRADSVFVFEEFSVSDVMAALNKAKLSPSCGPDDLPSIVFRKCASTLSYPLHFIFRKSIFSMMVPFIWKFANVMPLFKGGTHSSPSNYRPISLGLKGCEVSRTFFSF